MFWPPQLTSFWTCDWELGMQVDLQHTVVTVLEGDENGGNCNILAAQFFVVFLNQILKQQCDAQHQQ